MAIASHTFIFCVYENENHKVQVVKAEDIKYVFEKGCLITNNVK